MLTVAPLTALVGAQAAGLGQCCTRDQQQQRVQQPFPQGWDSQQIHPDVEPVVESLLVWAVLLLLPLVYSRQLTRFGNRGRGPLPHQTVVDG